MAAIAQKSSKSSIYKGPSKTVEEHFNLIINNNDYIEGKHRKVTPEDLPEWFDLDLFKKGHDYYNDNMMGIGLAYIAGFIAVLLIPPIAKSFTETIKQYSSPCIAYKRYIQTIFHIAKIHTNDIMDPNSSFYKSINVIRWKHVTSSERFMKNQGEGIYQKDMVLTQCSFVCYILVKNKMLSLTNDPEGRQGFNHMWRVIGYMLGIPDRINVCREDEKETTKLCAKLLKEVFHKELKSPRTDFYTLTEYAIKGLSVFNPLIDLDVDFSFFYELNDSKYEKKLSFYSEILRLYRKVNLYLMGKPVIGNVLRAWWNIVLRMSYWFQEFYPIAAWMKYGKKHTKLQLYPNSAFT